MYLTLPCLSRILGRAFAVGQGPLRFEPPSASFRRTARAEDAAEAVSTSAENLTFSSHSIIEFDGGRPLL